MSINVTQGGLKRGKLTNLITNQSVEFMFNPFEYTISKSNSWESRNVVGKNMPLVTFTQGGAQTISLTLYFDVSTGRNDVRQKTQNLWKMMMIDSSTIDATTGKGEPPKVAFEWGGLYFKSIITQLSEAFLLFNTDGVPMRSKVSISLQQVMDEESITPQTTGTTGAGNQQQSVTQTEGQRMDNIASDSGKPPSNYRDIASNNNIDNPNSVPNGKKLKV